MADEARFEIWDAGRAQAVIAGELHREGAALPILHALQETFGCVPEAATPLIADALNISRAEVFGIRTFYHDFRTTPPGRQVVKLCRAEACQSVGCEAAHDAIKARLGIGWHETTADGAVTLEPVFCLGLCACGPAALVDGRPVGFVDPDAIERELADA